MGTVSKPNKPHPVKAQTTLWCRHSLPISQRMTLRVEKSQDLTTGHSPSKWRTRIQNQDFAHCKRSISTKVWHSTYLMMAMTRARSQRKQNWSPSVWCGRTKCSEGQVHVCCHREARLGPSRGSQPTADRGAPEEAPCPWVSQGCPSPCRGGEGRGRRACRAPCRPDSLDPEVLRSVAVPTVGEVS